MVSSRCILRTAMKEFIHLFWSLTAHRDELSADFSPRRVKIREPDLSILAGNSCSIKTKKSPELAFLFLRRDVGPQKSELMDNNATNSEKSQLVHEKSAKMYSLKLQRWEHASHVNAAAWGISHLLGISLPEMHINEKYWIASLKKVAITVGHLWF